MKDEPADDETTLVGGEEDTSAIPGENIETVVVDERTRLDTPTPGPGRFRDPGATHPTARTLPANIGGDRQAKIEIGSVIDRRFVLVKKLGEGGMGLVFRAEDLIKKEARDPNPHVAIKILTPEFSDSDEAWISLQREAKKAQSLAHPRIATVFDFQVDRESGLCFVIMEELHGLSLNLFLKQHPDGVADRGRARSIILSIADGLEYAHRHGIIHSDLKPPNVFVTDKGEVKILDFGIARSMPGTDSDDFDAGALGALTPSYATCEMFERATPHPSDDLYALGIIAYKLFTGEHPYNEVLGSPEPAIEARELDLKPARPPGMKRNEWRSISRCLLHERAQRPADAGQFLAEFRRRNPLPRLLGVALAASALLLVWAIWFQEPILKPEIPFDQLPEAVREEFRVNLEEGWLVFQYKDYNGALTYFLKAYDLHPRNPEALEGLEAVVDVVLNEPIAADKISLETKLQHVDSLLSNDALAENSDLLDYRRELLARLQR